MQRVGRKVQCSPGKCSSNAQVKLLPHIHCVRHSFIQLTIKFQFNGIIDSPIIKMLIDRSRQECHTRSKGPPPLSRSYPLIQKTAEPVPLYWQPTFQWRIKRRAHTCPSVAMALSIDGRVISLNFALSTLTPGATSLHINSSIPRFSRSM